MIADSRFNQRVARWGTRWETQLELSQTFFNLLRAFFTLLATASFIAFFSSTSQASDKLHISLGDNYGKHAMLVDGKPGGIQKDLLNWFLKDHMKLDITLEAMPWKRAQLKVVEQKKSDGYFTAYTAHRVKVLRLVASEKPFYITNVKMHTWKGNPKIEELSKLSSIDELLAIEDIRHVFFRGHGYHEEQFGKAKNVHRTDSVSQIPKFLLDYKRADIFVEQSELFYPLAEEAGLIDRVHTLDNIPFRSLKWHLYIRPDSKHVGLMSEVNDALDKAIASGILFYKVREIFNSYGLKYAE